MIFLVRKKILIICLILYELYYMKLKIYAASLSSEIPHISVYYVFCVFAYVICLYIFIVKCIFFLLACLLLPVVQIYLEYSGWSKACKMIIDQRDRSPPCFVHSGQEDHGTLTFHGTLRDRCSLPHLIRKISGVIQPAQSTYSLKGQATGNSWYQSLIDALSNKPSLDIQRMLADCIFVCLSHHL